MSTKVDSGKPALPPGKELTWFSLCRGINRQNRIRMKTRSILLALIALVAVAQKPARPVDDNALKSAPKNPDEWLTYGRDYAETHYSPLKQIDART